MIKWIAILMNIGLLGMLLYSFLVYDINPRKVHIPIILTVVALTNILAFICMSPGSYLGAYFKRKRMEEEMKISKIESEKEST